MKERRERGEREERERREAKRAKRAKRAEWESERKRESETPNTYALAQTTLKITVGCLCRGLAWVGLGWEGEEKRRERRERRGLELELGS